MEPVMIEVAGGILLAVFVLVFFREIILCCAYALDIVLWATGIGLVILFFLLFPKTLLFVPVVAAVAAVAIGVGRLIDKLTS